MSDGTRAILVFAVVSVMLIAGCPGKETTTYVYQAPTPAGNFPGTPASASNLAEDAKALSPGGQDVTAVRVFWDGHDSFRAVALFETRSFLFQQENAQDNGDGTSTRYTMKVYFRHLWGTYFDGARLTPPVEIVGENMTTVGMKLTWVKFDQATGNEVESGEWLPWVDIVDSAAVLFYRNSATGAFSSGASSAAASARAGDAVILFKARDVDTYTGVTAKTVTNERVGTGAGGTTVNFSGALREKPVEAGSVSITDGTETFTDDGNGTLTGSAGGNGTIKYDDGQFRVRFNAAPGNGTAVRASYTASFTDNANDRLYYAYFDKTQAGVERADTADVVGTGASSAREFRWGFMTLARPVSPDAGFSTVGPTSNNVVSFGVLADGFLGQAWWGKDENKYDDGATFTHFLVALWTEAVSGYANARGVYDKVNYWSAPGNEVDVRLRGSVFNPESATFATPADVALDTAATELTSTAGYSSLGDSLVNNGFITYDNQVFFTYADMLLDNDPYTTPNWTWNAGGEGVDRVLNWNRYGLTSGTTTGAGAFLANSLRLSPATRPGLFGAGTGATTGDIADLVMETVNELDNQNGSVVFGADEGLGSTYVFFSHRRTLPTGTPPYWMFIDDADLYVAQVRHNATSGWFTAADDLLEVDTGSDAVAVRSEDAGAMTFSTTAVADDELRIGTTGDTGPVFDDWILCLVTAGTDTRFAVRIGSTGAGSTAFRTHWASPPPPGNAFAIDQDFTTSPALTNGDATIENTLRPVKDDWRIVLNKSSEWFLILYRQQDAKDQGLGSFGAGPNMMPYTGDVGLYASRLATTLAGGAPQPLSGQAVVGSNAKRLDADSPTESPLDAIQHREDAVAFAAQRELDPLIAVQSDLNRINVLFLKVLDDNPDADDARNDDTANQSYEKIMIVQVENGASALTLRPGQGGVEVGKTVFGQLTGDDAGTVMKSDKKFDEIAVALDAGIGGAAVVYYVKPTAPEVLIGGVYTITTPANNRMFAANFAGTESVGSILSGKQISSTGTDAQNQVMGFLPAMTRGVSSTAVNGLYHMVMFIEDRGWSSGGMIGGGALRSVRYNKAVPERGDTAVVAVTDAAAFTPILTGTTITPVQADFRAGDSLSYPFGYGMGDGVIGLYFMQFGEIYYTEYADATGKWWTDASGLPDPTLLSHEGFPGMPNAFIQAWIQGGSELFGAAVFGSVRLTSFTATFGTKTVNCLAWDNFHKALAIYAKDDGGNDPENDGTGFSRLFCRVRD